MEATIKKNRGGNDWYGKARVKLMLAKITLIYDFRSEEVVASQKSNMLLLWKH